MMYLANDVRWLVGHVGSLENEHLADVFSELHQVSPLVGWNRGITDKARSSQTLELLTAAPNVLDYLNPELRQANFSRVQLRTLQIVLHKLMAHYNSTRGAGVTTRRKHSVVRASYALATVANESHKRTGGALACTAGTMRGRSVGIAVLLRTIPSQLDSYPDVWKSRPPHQLSLLRAPADPSHIAVPRKTS